jgi:translation initiation factor 4A
MTDTEEFITPSTDVKVYESFDDMGLSEELLRGIYSNGFTKPSAIQTKGIMPMVERRDLIAQAQSGTGKTGTFVIGSLSTVDVSIKKPQVLILVHVRELAQQIAKVATTIGSYMKVKVLCAVGGNSVREDVSALEQGAQFVVGTPGRIFDLINRNALDRSQIRVLIMDEADQMLQELFFEQVMCILDKGFPTQTRVALFSATMPESVRTVASKILNDPVRILIPPSAVALSGIEQYFIDVEREDHKFECIADLYKNLNIAQAVIFCNMRKTAEKLTEKMTTHGFPVSCVHGELEKPERERRMRQFLGGESRVMIATDMIARGIDVQQISLVINYELPQNHETYIHRIGRAGRFGRKGVTINILLPEEVQTMKDIAEKFNIVLKETPQDLSNLL